MDKKPRCKRFYTRFAPIRGKAYYLGLELGDNRNLIDLFAADKCSLSGFQGLMTIIPKIPLLFSNSSKLTQKEQIRSKAADLFKLF